MNPAQKVLRRSEAARVLGVNRSTLWTWGRDGKLTPYRVAGKPVYLLSEIEDMAASKGPRLIIRVHH